MPAFDERPFRLHLDEPRFREAVRATAATTGFPAHLVEKDYHCSVLLLHLGLLDSPLVFKGGTCLTKIHAGFYRLSEDLDFSIPLPLDSTRSQRSRLARPLKSAVAAIETAVPGLFVRQAFSGANNSTQYAAQIAYRSVLAETEGTIKLEVGLREPMLRQPVRGNVRTLLLDPASEAPLVPDFEVACLSPEEAMAEKFRAALCRRDVAIRDFFDIDHAVRRGRVRLDDPELLELIRQKVAVRGNDPADTSAERLSALRRQVKGELAPVVPASDFAAFDLDSVFEMIAALRESLKA